MRTGLLGLGIAVGLGMAVPAWAADPVLPSSLPLSARVTLSIGNATVVAHPDGTPAPVGAGSMVLLDERALVGDVSARIHVRTKLLAEIAGDVTVARGTLQFGNQTHVTGDVTVAGKAVVGVSSVVDGDVVSVAGDVTVARLSAVGGDVFAGADFHGERDIVVGAPGSTVQVVGDATVRDRSEYFGDILHAGAIAFLGVGAPTLHGTVTQVGAGALAVPALPEWSLASMALAAVPPGADSVRVARSAGTTAVPPGAHRGLSIDRGATARLVSGEYTFDQIQTSSDARLEIDLSAPPHTLHLRVRGDVRLGRRFVMDVGTADPAAREAAAAGILVEAKRSVRVSPDAVVLGTFLAEDTIVFGKHTTFTGAAWSDGSLKVGRDSTVTWVPTAVAPAADPAY